jgi:hypothetical protein
VAARPDSSCASGPGATAFADEGVKIDQIIAGMGGGTTLRNMLASDLPYGEVATAAAVAATPVEIIVETASSTITHARGTGVPYRRAAYARGWALK